MANNQGNRRYFIESNYVGNGEFGCVFLLTVCWLGVARLAAVFVEYRSKPGVMSSKEA